MFEAQINKMKEINEQKNEIGREIANFINKQIEELLDNNMYIKDDGDDSYCLDSVYWDEEEQTLKFVTIYC